VETVALAGPFLSRGGSYGLSRRTRGRERNPATGRSGGKAILLGSGDVGNQKFCQRIVKKVVKELGRLNILVKKAAEHHVQGKGLPG
jgi:hypothetical protein